MEELIIAGVCIWLLRFVFGWVGAKKEKKFNIDYFENKELPFVSIIIPARNEENNIANCLDAFLKSDYPREKMEIICVNDGSEDRTPEIITNYQNNYDFIKLLTLTNAKRPKNLTGKTGALQAGFDIAEGECLLMTDADCIVSPKWISSKINLFKNSNADLIAGLTTIDYNETLFSKIQALEWFYMGSMASSGVGWNIPMGCFGNNLSITKDMKEKVGAYKDLPFSITEDQLLMLEVNRNKGRIRYNLSPKLSVKTHPVKDFKEYLVQHARWTQGIKDMGFMSVFLILCSVSLVTAEVLSLLFMPFYYFLGVLSVRIISDFVVMYPALKEYKEKTLIKYAIPGILFFIVMELIAPFFLLKKEHIWKGRTIET
jgi:cellulose synthase/poly-beta-1,6-N-acetylglucosamine synthase-like glycosyltransferase